MTDEEKTVDNTDAHTTPSDAAPANPSDSREPVDLILAAEQAVERLEKANAMAAQLLKEQQAHRVQQTLSGSADAGRPSKVSPDEKAKKNAREFLKGTGFEDELFPE